MAVKKQVEKDFAKVLFVENNLDRKEVAARVKVTEKTVGKWVIDGNWEKMRISLITIKDNVLKEHYNQLDQLNKEIASRPIVRDIPASLLKPIKLKDASGAEYLEYPKIKEEDYPIKIGNTPNTKDSLVMTQITNNIKKLETETNIGETIEISKQLIQFIGGQDLYFSKILTEYCDAFITAKMKK
ncbi:MAG: hypothetical protein GZ087_03335 [Flavobacterium sp.]|nr:hypothetical protein [Flavobacterium sp.]